MNGGLAAPRKQITEPRGVGSVRECQPIRIGGPDVWSTASNFCRTTGFVKVSISSTMFATRYVYGEWKNFGDSAEALFAQ